MAQEIEALVQSFLAGTYIDTLAERYGISVSSVQRLLRQHGVRRYPKGGEVDSGGCIVSLQHATLDDTCDRLAELPAGRRGFTFYLGAHQPGWLGRLTVPLFVSHRHLASCRALPVARHAWALDSGAFSELAQYGHWTLTPADYVAAVSRYLTEVGKPGIRLPQAGH